MEQTILPKQHEQPEQTIFQNQTISPCEFNLVEQTTKPKLIELNEK